jgi:hypothetical protein
MSVFDRMSEEDKEAYRNMLEMHLSILTYSGMDCANLIEGSVNQLEITYSRKSEVGEDEDRELLKILISAANKHKEIIQSLLQERQEFIDSMQDKYKDV